MNVIDNITPVISVLMSVYKEPVSYLCEAINSILNQSFRDFEFIIINDNPRSVEHRQILEDYRNTDPRIILINNLENIGLTKSLNIGLSFVRGKYIARMDADDISLPERFAKQVAIMEEHTEVGITGCWVEHFGKRKKIEKKCEHNDDIKIEMFFSAPFDHPATMMRSCVLKDFNIKYDEGLRYAQDRKLWFDLSLVTDFYNIPEILFKHRANVGQVSALHKEEQLRNVALIRREQIKTFFRIIGFQDIDYDNITCHTIARLIRFRKQHSLDLNDRKKINKIVNVLFLSLDSYNAYTLLYFLISMEYFGRTWNLKDFVRIIIKNLMPAKIQRGGIRLADEV